MEDGWIVDSAPSERYPIWTRGNVGEVFPDPVAPLSATYGIDPYSEPGWRDAFVRFGAFDLDELDPNNNVIIGIFGGYCYLNVSVSRVFAVRTPGLTPEDMDFQLWGTQPGITPYEPVAGDESPAHTERIQQTLQWILTTDGLSELDDDRRRVDAVRADRPDMSSLSDEQLIERARGLMRDHFRYLFAQHLFVTYCATVPVGIIQQVCGAVGRPDALLALVAGFGDVDSAAPSFAMWELSRLAPDSAAFAEGFAHLLAEHGCRGPNEWEGRCPTWETEPALALAAIDQMRAMPDDTGPDRSHVARAQDRERLADEISALVEGDPETHGQLLAALRAASIFLPGRERSKTNAIRLLHEGRVCWYELGRRMVERGHFDDARSFGVLRDSEIDEWLKDPGAWVATIREREEEMAELARREPPFVFEGTIPPLSTWPLRNSRPVAVAAPGDVLTGLPGCPGSATGRARIVLDPHDPTALAPGDVLVAPSTDPAWTPLFVPAAAVVVDVGAPLSHAVIVSRELGIPCAVSVTDATRAIPDGALVTVDGTSGTVTVLEV